MSSAPSAAPPPSAPSLRDSVLRGARLHEMMSIAQMLFDHKARELREAQQQMDWTRARQLEHELAQIKGAIERELYSQQAPPFVPRLMPAPPRPILDPELIRRYMEEQAKRESALAEEQIKATEAAAARRSQEESWREAYEREKSGDVGPDGRDSDQ